ncbi:hypothetical protein RAS2_08520 [Phycisphaerae bacterium RAS2]|nr:hypothetical protein RAS2_08520 [Phycisphaerae bacterium RAS2]
MYRYVCTCAILVGCSIATSVESSAGVVAWQLGEPLTANSSIESQGNLGSSLFLRCDATAEQCKWRITTRVRIDTGTLNAYDVHLRDPAGAGTYLSISDTTFTNTPWSDVTFAYENSGPFLSRIDANVPIGQPQVPAGPTIYDMYSYVLTSQAGVAPGTLTQLRAGSNGFIGTNPGPPPQGFFRPTAFGANPGFFISGGMEWPNPVIHINYVPEPATAALLLTPAMLLMRRRRPRDRSHRRDQRRCD